MTYNAEDDLESPQKDLTTCDVPTPDHLTTAPTTISPPYQLHNNDRKPHPVISPPSNDEYEMGEGESTKVSAFGICHSMLVFLNMSFQMSSLYSEYNLSRS